MDLSFSDLNFNSVETLPGFEARAAFTVNSSSVFKEDVAWYRRAGTSFPINSFASFTNFSPTTSPPTYPSNSHLTPTFRNFTSTLSARSSAGPYPTPSIPTLCAVSSLNNPLVYVKYISYNLPVLFLDFVSCAAI